MQVPLFIVLVAASVYSSQYAGAQIVDLPENVTLTVAIAPKVIPRTSSQQTCPPPDLMGRAREEILTEIRDILEESVIPIIGLQCDYGKCPENPASSCQELNLIASGKYWVLNSTGDAVHVFCDMDTRCGTTPGWVRVGFLNASDVLDFPNCPGGLRLIPNPQRSCGRPTGQAGCMSVHYAAQGINFSKVCGRVLGYQFRGTNAFRPYNDDPATTLEEAYVDGVSVTYGTSPRKHIWSFASAIDETRSNDASCPCIQDDSEYQGIIPPFVGNDYFCDTGSERRVRRLFYSADPLWDGEGCGLYSSCCSFNSPPWFYKELSNSTVEDIELRLCGDQNAGLEDTPIQLVELYIQ